MKIPPQLARGLAAITLAAPAMLPTTTLADQAYWDPGSWRFTAGLYAWFPNVDGRLNFPTWGGTFVVDPDELLDSRNFALAGNLEAHNGQWGVFVDYFRMNADGSASGTQSFSIGGATVPAYLTGQVDLDLKTSAWTIAGEYRLTSQPDWQLDLLAGLRRLSVDSDLSWAFAGNVDALRLPARAGTASQNPSNWDALIGVKGAYRFGAGQEWHVPLYFDIGTGNSKRTWQVAAGIGYSLPWGDLVAMWRYLDYRFDDGEPVRDLSFSGPMLGVQFRW